MSAESITPSRIGKRWPNSIRISRAVDVGIRYSFLHLIFLYESPHPITLLLCRYEIVLLKALCHVVNKCAFVGAYTSAIQRDAIKKHFELLNLLAQYGHFSRRECISRLGRHGFLPFAKGFLIAIPGAKTSQFIGSFVLVMSCVPTNPYKGWRSSALFEQDSIQIPQVGISFHLVHTLSHFNDIFTVTIDG